MRKRKTLIAVTISALALGACQSSERASVPAQPRGVATSSSRTGWIVPRRAGPASSSLGLRPADLVRARCSRSHACRDEWTVRRKADGLFIRRVQILSRSPYILRAHGGRSRLPGVRPCGEVCVTDRRRSIGHGE